jgi:hypothetical protein
VKPPAAIATLEAFDYTVQKLQQKLTQELQEHGEVATKTADSLQGYGCLDTYRKNITATASSFRKQLNHGTRLVACYLDGSGEDLPMAIYRIEVDLKGRRGIDYCQIENAIYRPGVTKGDHVSESVLLSRKGARYVRRVGFDKLRMWIMEVRGWFLADDPPPKLV